MREQVESFAVMLRLLVGWAGVALGALNLAMGLTDIRYVLFHAVLLIGGALLLAWGRAIRPAPARIAVAAGGLVTAGGLVISAIPQVAACCLRDSAVRHGFPFAVLGRDPARFSGWHLLADLVFWALLGLLVTVLLPGRRRTGRPAEPEKPPHPTHAEQRAATAPAPDDENVGGHP